LTEAATNHNFPSDDPLLWFLRLLTKANSVWLGSTYPFNDFGRKVSIHYSCEIRRSYSHKIKIGDSVLLDREVWLNVPVVSGSPGPILVIGNGSNIGRRSVISATNGIFIHENVLFAPGVFVTDHNHKYSDPDLPISQQGTTSGGKIVIERNCWLGYGSMVLSGTNEVVLGRNSVVGAYSVVTKSCPPNSVLVGNPARVVKRFDPASGTWTRC
jgi:abequosyltransferase